MPNNWDVVEDENVENGAVESKGLSALFGVYGYCVQHLVVMLHAAECISVINLFFITVHHSTCT